MKIAVAHSNKILSSMSLVTLIGSVLLTISMIVWLIFRAQYGLDLTDESSYLNWIANPWIYKSSISQFGFIYHPLYLATQGDIAHLRQVNIIIIYILSWILFSVFLKNAINHDKTSSSQSILTIVLAANFATTSFLYLSTFRWLITPSYNSLTLEALIITSIGALLAQKEKSYSSLFGWMLLGFGGWLCFMAKPSSAIALSIATGIYLLLSGKFNFKYIFFAVATTIVFFLLSAWGIDGSLTSFFKRHTSGLINMKLMGVDTPLLRFDFFSLSKSEKYVLIVNTFLLVVISYFTTSKNKYLAIISLSTLSMIVIFGFLIIANIVPTFFTVHDYAIIQITAVPFSAIILACLFLKREFLRKIDRTHWSQLLYFMSIPYVLAFGTSNKYWMQSQLASFFWLLGSLVILIPAIANKMRWNILLTLAVGAQIITIITLQLAMEFPYRQNAPLYQMNSKTEIGKDHAQLIFSKDTSNFYKNIQEIAKEAGFKPNTPMLDLTGNSPGLLYILGAKAIGQAWMIGGYKGSDQLAIASLSTVSCDDISAAWLLIEPKSNNKLSPEILNQFEINIEKAYTRAAEISMPIENRNLQIWRPSRSTKDAIDKCIKIKRRS